MPGSEMEQAMTKRAAAHLDKGLKAIACRHKNIRITDCQELGWQVITTYESDKLVSD